MRTKNGFVGPQRIYNVLVVLRSPLDKNMAAPAVCHNDSSTTPSIHLFTSSCKQIATTTVRRSFLQVSFVAPPTIFELLD